MEMQLADVSHVVLINSFECLRSQVLTTPEESQLDILGCRQLNLIPVTEPPWP